MARHIHKCLRDGRYTLNEVCLDGSKSILVNPPKFSLKDKYASYRRKIKKKELIEKGLF